MKPPVDPKKIVVLSGSGISAESGLPTFRDSNGLWRKYSWEEVASPEGWEKNPELVLEFFNERRKMAWEAKPNAAHIALAELEKSFNVVVITQNVDELHERGGSSNVIHVHGELAWVRSEVNNQFRLRVNGDPIRVGQLAPDGCQFRPDVVWFGEEVYRFDECKQHVLTAGKVLVVGTSLTVFPVASLVKQARGRAEKCLVSIEIEKRPFGFRHYRGVASIIVPTLVRDTAHFKIPFLVKL